MIPKKKSIPKANNLKIDSRHQSIDAKRVERETLSVGEYFVEHPRTEEQSCHRGNNGEKYPIFKQMYI